MGYTEQTIKVDPLARKVEDKNAAGQAAGMAISSDASASTAIAGGASATFSVTLASSYGLRLYAFPEFTLYKTTVSAANAIPDGASVTPSDYDILAWIDKRASDTNNIVLKVYVRNTTAGSQTILLRANFRYILESKSVS